MADRNFLQVLLVEVLSVEEVLAFKDFRSDAAVATFIQLLGILKGNIKTKTTHVLINNSRYSFKSINFQFDLCKTIPNSSLLFLHKKRLWGAPLGFCRG